MVPVRALQYKIRVNTNNTRIMYSNIVLIMHNTTRHLEMSHTKIYFFQANVATRHDILVNLFEAKVARNVATSTLRARRRRYTYEGGRGKRAVVCMSETVTRRNVRARVTISTDVNDDTGRKRKRHADAQLAYNAVTLHKLQKVVVVWYHTPQPFGDG